MENEFVWKLKTPKSIQILLWMVAKSCTSW
jgi:hypothetical protein